MKKSKKIFRYISKLSYLDQKHLLEAMKECDFDKQIISEIEREIFERKNEFRTQIIKKENGSNAVKKIYAREIEKILFITSNPSIMGKIGGLKILINGATGTGKTTLANEIISNLNNYKIHKFVAEELISPKMGQTQLNILKLEQELKSDEKKIFFIDEVDSIISNRYNDKDLTEYHRITSSFIKLLDNISKDKIVIFSTNLLDKIDEAIQRRMNFKISSKTIDIKNFINYLSQEIKIMFSTYKKNILNDMYKEVKFTVSDLNDFTNEYLINKEVNSENNNFLFFLKFFKQKKQGVKYYAKTERLKTEFLRSGIENEKIQN